MVCHLSLAIYCKTYWQCLIGKRVAWLKVVFRIPDEHITKLSLPRQIGHLAYVEWFSRPRNKDSNSGMYPISRSYQNGVQEASVIEVDCIFWPCQLVPRFGWRANRAWTSSNVIDRCKHFLINNFIDHHTYQSIWWDCISTSPRDNHLVQLLHFISGVPTSRTWPLSKLYGWARSSSILYL